MKTKFLLLCSISALLVWSSCKKDEEEDPVVVAVDPGTSTTELLVKAVDVAPTLDGNIDDVWGTVQTLTGTVTVPTLSARGTYLNSDGAGVEEGLGLFEPYSGESNDFKMRAASNGDYIYFLIEWDDDADSKDRQSWYFDSTDSLWKGEHKYANADDDKFYEDKFSFLFPVGTVTDFASSTCYATCHTGLTIANAKDKHSRHYLSVDGEQIDMWHWKRVRGAFAGQVDDQQMVYADGATLLSAANGRKGDATGSGGYSNNSQSLALAGNTANMVNVPKYVIPGASNYYWITETEIDDGTAKLITAVAANGVLTYSGGTIDPTSGGYEQGIGSKRLPSVTIKAFTEGRGDIDIASVHTGSGWICEVRRELNTGDSDDVVFDLSTEIPFGFAIFNNAAIAHAIKPNLILKY